MRYAHVLALVICGLVQPSQAQTNISFVGQLSYQELHNSQLANLWGYADELGNEYALVGVNGVEGDEDSPGGISVVDLSDPSDPQEVFFLPGPASRWREIKVWGDHAYMTTEADEGYLTIVDLSPLPQSTDLPSTIFVDEGWDTSHSLFIDENGRLYIHGANEGNGGVIMYDLTQDPENPVRVGSFDQWYVHDSFARGDTLYAAHILAGFFSIVDVSDPSAPDLISTQNTPNNFTHNTWLDASGRYLYTTDERPSSFVAAYDVSDPTDIRFVDRLQSDPGSEAIPHNTYWMPTDHVIQSYYTYGVTIYDTSRPWNMVEVGHFDTSPIEGGGFYGAWGVYPYFPSGRIIISDIEEGLFVLDPVYVRASWVEGAVRNSVSGLPVGSADLVIEGTEANDRTAIDGLYGMGMLEPGTYTITVTAPTYYPTTVTGVVLETGEVTILDIEMDPLPSYSINGVVRTVGTAEPVPGAQIWLVNGTYTFNAVSGADGSFSIPTSYDGTYTVDCAAWGWRGACPADLVVNGADIEGWVIELAEGYADDFALDLGWSVSGTAVRGQWVRARPAGTSNGDGLVNPQFDVEGDCRDMCFDTGNSGGNPGSDDVDDGGTLLTSPEFDATGMEDPHVRFHYWFYNGGGEEVPDDALVISLTDGTDTVAIFTVSGESGSASAWRFSNIRIADHIPPGSTMRLLAFTSDTEPNGHLVEAGLDDVSVVPNASTGLPAAVVPGFMLWPDPAHDHFHIQLSEVPGERVEILDAAGRKVFELAPGPSGTVRLNTPANAGTYLVRVITPLGTHRTTRLVVER